MKPFELVVSHQGNDYSPLALLHADFTATWLLTFAIDLTWFGGHRSMDGNPLYYCRISKATVVVTAAETKTSCYLETPEFWSLGGVHLYYPYSALCMKREDCKLSFRRMSTSDAEIVSCAIVQFNWSKLKLYCHLNSFFLVFLQLQPLDSLDTIATE